MNKYVAGNITCKICNKNYPVEVYSERELHELMDDWKLIKDHAENQHWYNYHYDCAICGKWIEPKNRELLYGELLNTPFIKNYIRQNNGIERVCNSCLKKLLSKNHQNQK